jgi:hypothetical protein
MSLLLVVVACANKGKSYVFFFDTSLHILILAKKCKNSKGKQIRGEKYVDPCRTPAALERPVSERWP